MTYIHRFKTTSASEQAPKRFSIYDRCSTYAESPVDTVGGTQMHPFGLNMPLLRPASFRSGVFLRRSPWTLQTQPPVDRRLPRRDR